MKKKIFLILLFLVPFIFTACSDNRNNVPTETKLSLNPGPGIPPYNNLQAFDELAVDKWEFSVKNNLITILLSEKPDRQIYVEVFYTNNQETDEIKNALVFAGLPEGKISIPFEAGHIWNIRVYGISDRMDISDAALPVKPLQEFSSAPVEKWTTEKDYLIYYIDKMNVSEFHFVALETEKGNFLVFVDSYFNTLNKLPAYGAYGVKNLIVYPFPLSKRMSSH